MHLDDLIARLSDESQSITDILLKTKVLLADIEQPELVGWVNRELNGYPDAAELPAYRVVPAQVRANLIAMTFRVESHPIPLAHIEPEQREHLESSEVRDGLPVIEALVRKSGGRVQRPLPMEANGVLAKGLAEGVHINQAWVEIGDVHLANIPAQVRSRLLDFMLELRANVGRDVSTDKLKERSQELDMVGAFHGAVFGDNVTINLGSNIRQIVRNTKVTSEADLFATLKDVGVEPAELDELKKALDQDTSERGKPTLEGATGRWFTALLSKASVGALKIGANVVTSVVAAALTHYLAGN